MSEARSRATGAARRKSNWWPPVLVFCLVMAASVLLAQTPAATPQDSTSQQNANPGQQPPPPEAGGPQSDTGPYALPKMDTDKQPARPAPPPSPKPAEGMPSYSINVDVPLVSVDALVLTKDGQFIPGLQKEQFRILEDNVAQPIQSFCSHQGWLYRRDADRVCLHCRRSGQPPSVSLSMRCAPPMPSPTRCRRTTMSP